MNIEEVIARLEAQGGECGQTAKPDAPDYGRASKLDFVRCSVSDDSYEAIDYIAKTPRGAYVYVSMNTAGPTKGRISCGPKGYHWYRDTKPCV